MRDNFSSYTTAKLIPNETADTLRCAIIETTAELKSPQGAVIRVDGAPAFQSLSQGQTLAHHGLSLEIGRLKNINKNPIAEKAIQELETELRKQHPSGSPISSADLALAIATLNSRVRDRGLSAHEILFQRDTLTGEKLNITDSHLSEQQYQQRRLNHGPSARSKAPKGQTPLKPLLSPGDLVYIKCEGSKHKARDRYLVTACHEEFVTVNKLVGPQLRSKGYKMKYSELYKVPCVQLPKPPPQDTYHSDTSDTSTACEPVLNESDNLLNSSSDSDSDVAASGGLHKLITHHDPAKPVQEPLDLEEADSQSNNALQLDISLPGTSTPLDHVGSEDDATNISETDISRKDIPKEPNARTRNPPVWLSSGEWQL
jgi:hypothetical protein